MQKPIGLQRCKSALAPRGRMHEKGVYRQPFRVTRQGWGIMLIHEGFLNEASPGREIL